MGREIFISYSRDDKALVHPFVEQISKAVGKDCWIDLKGIESGEEFEEVIMKAIDECKVVLFMLSDSSLRKSKWTKREVYYAERRGKRIIPVVVDGNGLRGWFDFHFGNIDFIDIRSEEQKQKLIHNLRDWLGVEKVERKAEEEAKRKAAEEAKRKEEEARRKKEVQKSPIKQGTPQRQNKAYTLLAKVKNTMANNPKISSGAALGIIMVISGFLVLRLIDEKRASNSPTFNIDSTQLEIVQEEKGEDVMAKRKAEEEAKRMAEEERQEKPKELENIKLKPLKKDGKYGFADEAGNIVIPCKWEDAYSFSQGLALIEDDNGKRGFIDKTGTVVIPCKWKDAYSFSEGLARVEDDNEKWGFIDKTGTVVIPCKWKFAGGFSEGLAAVGDDNCKWGYIDKTGNVVIPCKWECAFDFSEGLAAVQDDNGEWGYIDKTGNVVIPCTWKDAWNFSEGLARVQDDNGKWGYIDKTGKVVIPCKWEVPGYFFGGLAEVQDDNGKWWKIDKTGKVVREVK